MSSRGWGARPADMPVIVISSPKGGVGKTTLTANLAVALARLNWNVVAVDFDSQDALKFHLGVDRDLPLGVNALLNEGRDWRWGIVPTGSGVRLIPHGPSSLLQTVEAEQRVSPELLRRQFHDLAPGPTDLVIADTAPGQNRFLASLEAVADIGLVVFLADAGSMALLPAYQQGRFLRPNLPGEPRVFGVLNQVDPRRRLSREIKQFTDENLPERFLGTVHYDEAMSEALAYGSTVLERSSSPIGAAGDIMAIASRLTALLA